MGIEETRNRGFDGHMSEAAAKGTGGGGSCNCNSNSVAPAVSRSEAMQLMGQLSDMLPRLERSLRG